MTRNDATPTVHDELDELLGVEPDNPEHRLAVHLAEEDERLIEQLIAYRKERGLRQKDIAVAIGRDPSVISTFESISGDPRLSTIRRYALAVGAAIHHEVTDSEYGIQCARLNWEPVPHPPVFVTYTDDDGGFTYQIDGEWTKLDKNGMAAL